MSERICDVAERVLRKTDNPAVMWGDFGLLDSIAKEAGRPLGGHPLVRHSKILDALSRTPGRLVPGTTLDGRGRRVRIFWLHEHVPEHLK